MLSIRAQLWNIPVAAAAATAARRTARALETPAYSNRERHVQWANSDRVSSLRERLVLLKYPRFRKKTGNLALTRSGRDFGSDAHSETDREEGARAEV